MLRNALLKQFSKRGILQTIIRFSYVVRLCCRGAVLNLLRFALKFSKKGGMPRCTS